MNGPLGLEQGFTLERAPGGAPGRTIDLHAHPLGRGDLKASLEPGGDGLSLSRADGSIVLRYRGLSAQDATGRELGAWLQVQGAQLLLRVDDTGAQYPLAVDPFVEQAQLTASDGAADGDDIGANADQGSAYVFGSTVSPSTDLSITKTDGPDPVFTGQTLTYTYLHDHRHERWPLNRYRGHSE